MKSHKVIVIVSSLLGLTACGGSDGVGPDRPEVAVYTAVSAGSYHTCALTDRGAAYCWGQNIDGQLGDGTQGTQLTPVPVKGDLTFTLIAAGDVHTCALTPLGEAYCWGSNWAGQLGEGGQVLASRDPMRSAPGLVFTSLSAGGAHTCGLLQGGEAYCWGNSFYGQLGIGTRGTAVRTSTEPEPRRVVGNLRFASVSAGGEHTCALTRAGEAYCWGSGLFAQLGDGTDSIRLVPTRVASTENFGTIAAGGVGSDLGHTCAIAGLATYCWGDNSWGQLGSPLEECKSFWSCKFVPEPVQGGPSFGTVATGLTHSCGLANNGAAYCWGAYALGDGKPAVDPGNVFAVPRPQPVAVVGGHTFTSIAVGVTHSCGLRTDGAVFCWGLSTWNVLGSEDADGLAPSRVAEPE